MTVHHTKESFETKIFELIKGRVQKILSRGIKPNLSEILEDFSKEESIVPSDNLKERVNKWYGNIFELDFMASQILDESIEEILLHGPSQGQIVCEEKKAFTFDGLSREDYQECLSTLALLERHDWNFSEGFASFFVTLKGKLFRATLCHHSLMPGIHSKLFLRRIKGGALPLESFGLSGESLEQLKRWVSDQRNIIIAGSTGSGKTTFLRSILEMIPSRQHLIIIEDTHELRLDRANVTSLLGKELQDFCAYALRMAPDRLVLGEIRSREVIPFFLSMNTGHKGMMSTVHADSAPETFARLGLLFSLYQTVGNLDYSLVMKLLCQSLDIIVFLKEKRVVEIIKVIGSEKGQPYYEYLFKASS